MICDNQVIGVAPPPRLGVQTPVVVVVVADDSATDRLMKLNK